MQELSRHSLTIDDEPGHRMPSRCLFIAGQERAHAFGQVKVASMSGRQVGVPLRVVQE